MTYTVLARKYRPQTFGDLVGQEHVSRTIGNAIESGRVAHAFLFTGARGVGKTTTARLLAKALNCEKGPTATPCNACDACREITVGTDLDVLEIDGASNNSVDDVRRLQETLPFRPARDRFKVVIVDEVHMLSTGAFNAFLKTLEEPPSHVKFIFATTEVHKVPVTIRSRCQRYDFRLIPNNVVAGRVREILVLEKIEADDAAVALVAREAAGSMRDALTVLDQLLALGSAAQGGLKGEDVARGLGIASRKHVFDTLSALLEGDAATCLRAVADVAAQGLDMLHFSRQLLELTRDVVVLQVLGDDGELVDLVSDERAQAQAIAAGKPRPELERAFAGLGKLVEDVGLSSTPYVTLEMGLVRLSDRPPLRPLQELIERIKKLEAQISAGGPSGGGGGGPRASGPGGGGGGGGGASRPTMPSGSRAETFSVPPQFAGPSGSSVAPAPASTKLLAPEPQPVAAKTAVARAPERAPAPSQPAAQPAPAQPAPAPRASQPAQPPSAAANDPRANAPSTSPGTLASPAAAPAPVATPAATTAALPAAAPVDTSDTHAAWLQIVTHVKSAQPALAAVLEHGMPLEVTPKALRLGFPEGSFFGRQAQSPAAREAILKTAELVFGVRPELTIDGKAGNKVATLAEVDQEQKRVRKAEREHAALSHPKVRDALEVFETTEGNVVVQLDGTE